MKRSLVMAAMAAVGATLAGCQAQPSADANAAGAVNMADQPAATTALGDVVDWVDVWWRDGKENGASIDTKPVKVGEDPVEVRVRPTLNDMGTPVTGTPNGKVLTVTIDGKTETLTQMTGDQTGVAVLKGKKRCLRRDPKGEVYCALVRGDPDFK